MKRRLVDLLPLWEHDRLLTIVGKARKIERERGRKRERRKKNIGLLPPGDCDVH